MGGEVFATAGIAAASIGSATSATTIGIDPDPEIALELAGADKEIGRCVAHIAQIAKTLNLEGLEAENFKEIISRTSVPRRPKLIKVLRQLKNFIERRSAISRQRERLRDRMIATVSNAEIVIKGRVYAGATVIMAGQPLKTDHDLDGVTFFSKPAAAGVGYRRQ